MPQFFTRFSAVTLAFVIAFGSLQFSAENLFQAYFSNVLYAQNLDDEVEVEEPAPTTTTSTTETPVEVENESIDNNLSFSTLGKAQSALTAQEMRGYQSLYEMQAELFAECVAKLKRWDGGAKPLEAICAEEKKEMDEQGPQRLLIPDATEEQTITRSFWWESVIKYWFGGEETAEGGDTSFKAGLLPSLKQAYTRGLRTPNAPTAKPANADLKKALEGWYGRANSLGGEAFLWHYLTKKSLHAVPFQQGIVTISNCPNLSSPIFANQDCVKTEWDKRTNQLDNQRAKLIQKIEKQLKVETGGNSDEDTITNAKDLIAWYAVDDTDVISNEDYGLEEIDAKRNALQLDIQKLSFLVSLLKQLAKYSGTVAYQLDLSKNTTGGMGIYGNFSSTNAGVDIAQITNLSGKENLTLSQTISKLSNIMLIIALAIMIPVIVYAGFLMVLSGYDYEQYERGNELLWKVLPWAVWACGCRFLIAAWIHVLTEAFRPIASF